MVVPHSFPSVGRRPRCLDAIIHAEHKVVLEDMRADYSIISAFAGNEESVDGGRHGELVADKMKSDATTDGEEGGQLTLHAVVAAVDGSASVRLSTSGSLGEAERLGRELASALLAEGASRLIEERVT